MTRAILALVAFFWVISSTQARWKPEYAQNSLEIQKWFNTQHNSTGQWCCNEADGHRFDGAYAFDANGNVTIYEGGKEYKIEKFKVLNGHNPTGSAVWWFLDTAEGRMTYCFSPGSLT